MEQTALDILLVEDDPDLRQVLVQVLARAGHQVHAVADGPSALTALDIADALVTDLRMPGMDGLELVRLARARRPELDIIVMTAFGSVDSAVEAMRMGARAYLTKPFTPDELLLHLRETATLAGLRAAASMAKGPGRGDLVGASAAMQRAFAEIDLAAASDAPVLIAGETGTGKELAARAVHQLSARSGEPYVALNCAALPRELAESELFGHLPGAFTGAAGRRRGRFALAGAGTLFLDEIDSLPLELQPKLLRVLETGEFWPLGGEQVERSRARVVAACNRRLEGLIEDGRFREDLFYRLNVLRINLPPLRERPEDIPQLARVLLARGGGGDWTFSPQALAQLVARPWPGNVRELANAVERARARAVAESGPAGGEIQPHHLDAAAEGFTLLPFKEGRARAAEEWARRAIRAALATTSGNVSQAAKLLKMSRTALIRLRDRYGLR